MAKIDKLLNKTVRDGEAKKWVVVVAIIIGVSIAYCGLGFLLELEGVNTYISETKQVVAVYDFYDLKVGQTQTAVYFIGSSIVGCGIDSVEINKILSDKGYNITVYNLGQDGESPLQTTVQTQNIIDSKPSLVIFGISYIFVGDSSLNEEKIFLVKNHLKPRSDSLYLYSNDDLLTLYKPHTFLDNKRFVESAKKYIPKGTRQTTSVISTDLYTLAYGSEWRYNEENNPKYSRQGIIDDANSDYCSPVVTTEVTSNKEALLYSAKTLNDSGIPVIILNMPLHPLVSEHVTDESRDNFFSFLNTTGSLWYDYEFACPDEDYWYKDGHHMAPVTGSKLFAHRMADLIIEQVENDVIHYT